MRIFALLPIQNITLLFMNWNNSSRIFCYIIRIQIFIWNFLDSKWRYPNIRVSISIAVHTYQSFPPFNFIGFFKTQDLSILISRGASKPLSVPIILKFSSFSAPVQRKNRQVPNFLYNFFRILFFTMTTHLMIFLCALIISCRSDKNICFRILNSHPT